MGPGPMEGFRGPRKNKLCTSNGGLVRPNNALQNGTGKWYNVYGRDPAVS
jgi:hypothetical protein